MISRLLTPALYVSVLFVVFWILSSVKVNIPLFVVYDTVLVGMFVVSFVNSPDVLLNIVFIIFFSRVLPFYARLFFFF